MSVAEPIDGALDDAQRLLRRQEPRPVENAAKGRSLHVFADQPGPGRSLDEVVYGDAVGAVQSLQLLGVRAQALQEKGVSHQGGRELLDGDVALEFRFVSDLHGAAVAGAECPHDFVLVHAACQSPNRIGPASYSAATSAASSLIPARPRLSARATTSPMTRIAGGPIPAARVAREMSARVATAWRCSGREAAITTAAGVEGGLPAAMIRRLSCVSRPAPISTTRVSEAVTRASQRTFSSSPAPSWPVTIVTEAARRRWVTGMPAAAGPAKAEPTPATP